MIEISETHDTAASAPAPTAAAKPARRPGEYRAPLPSDERQARLVYERGTANDTIVVDPNLGELFVARFERGVPRIEVIGSEVRIRNLRGRRHRGWITLSGRVPWAIEVRGGAARVQAELGEADIAEVAISGGASHVDLELPAPRRVVPVRIGGGAHALLVAGR